MKEMNKHLLTSYINKKKKINNVDSAKSLSQNVTQLKYLLCKKATPHPKTYLPF